MLVFVPFYRRGKFNESLNSDSSKQAKMHEISVYGKNGNRQLYISDEQGAKKLRPVFVHLEMVRFGYFFVAFVHLFSCSVRDFCGVSMGMVFSCVVTACFFGRIVIWVFIRCLCLGRMEC